MLRNQFVMAPAPCFVVCGFVSKISGKEFAGRQLHPEKTEGAPGRTNNQT
jgi:hypothetical protein